MIQTTSKPVLATDQLDIMMTVACNAHCPFCVQEATFRPESTKDERFLAAVDLHARDFHELGGRKIVITGGEPLLKPKLVLATLQRLQKLQPFDLIALYTNGSLLLEKIDGSERPVVAELAANGLTAVNLSVHHSIDEVNGRILGLPAKPCTESLASAIVENNLSLRMNCVMQKGGVETLEDVVEYVGNAFRIGATDVYLRELFHFSIKEPVSQSRYNPLPYIESHCADVANLVAGLSDHPSFELQGTSHAEGREKTEYHFHYLPTGKSVYVADLTIGTESRSALPYLILMPNGFLYRGWLGKEDRIDSLSSASHYNPIPFIP